MIAVSGFYKDFKDPIELVSFPQASNQITVTNTGNARVIGAEVEFRQALGFIANSLENLRLTTNVSIMDSDLKMTDKEYGTRLAAARNGENIKDSRNMQGQAPYLINAGLDYGNDDKGFRAGIFYNVQGKTLEVVGTGYVTDVYSKPFHSLNFTLNKAFGEDKKSAIDFKVSNILGSDRESVYESYQAADQVYQLRSPGTEISLGYSYKF